MTNAQKVSLPNPYISHFLSTLNQTLQAYPEAMHKLFSSFYALETVNFRHPTVKPVDTSAGEMLGVLNVINGFLGTGQEGDPAIKMVVIDGKIIRFELSEVGKSHIDARVTYTPDLEETEKPFIGA